MNDAVRQQGLEKAPTGIHGFDEISHGGLPRGHVTVVLGGAGTGKTVFALQALAEGARRFHEPGLFVAFEESSAQVVRNAANFGWPLTREEGIDFFDAHLSGESIRSGGFDIAALLAGVGVKARAIGAKRIVFDAIDVLLSLIGDRPREATELYRVRDWMEANGLTGIVTSRVPGADQSVTGWEAPSSVLLPFMADCVICLQKKTTQRIALRNLQIIKYRGSFHGQNEYGFVIGPSGIELSRLAFAETATSVPQEQVTTGVLRLDTMLRGGYYRGSSTLITGAPGTAKTTLAIAFANAACTRGERVLYIAFDESPAELIRNFRSINIDLTPHLEKDLLRIHASRPEAHSADDYAGLWEQAVDAWGATCLVIDPFSALLKAGGELAAILVATEIIRAAKARKITVVATSLTGAPDPFDERTDVHVSTVADIWIHLSFAVQAGERNRALTIIKARGIGHSRQVREIVISDRGVDLADVYSAGGAVIMGTMRKEKERADEAERERMRVSMESARQEFKNAEADIQLRIAALESELRARRSTIELLMREHEAKERLWEAQRISVKELRGVDEP